MKMKEACASVSDPAMPSPRTPVASPSKAFRPDRTTSDTKLQRPSSVNKRGHGLIKGSDGGDRLRKGYKTQSHQYSGDAETNARWRTEMRRCAHALRDARNHLNDLHQKALSGNWGPEDVRAATSRAAQLLREAERLQRNAAELQRSAVGNVRPKAEVSQDPGYPSGYQPGDSYEPTMVHELRMLPPSTLLAPMHHDPANRPSCGPGSLRSKSELELSRRLSESLDMQERLAADNADLDVKRYILYKELMVKEQRLETARAQAARLQAELKMLARDNARLQAAVNAHPSSETAQSPEKPVKDKEGSGEPGDNHADLERQLSELEVEVREVREMATTRHDGKLCGGQPCIGGKGVNICYQQQPGMPPMPPVQRDCKVCPPCPAFCNPDAPLTPAEQEVIELKGKLQASEDECKDKIAECALLRADVLKFKEEAEKQRCIVRETKARLRDLEMRFEGLSPVTKFEGTPEQAFEAEINVQNLRKMLREATSEIEDQRTLLAEMDVQLQDYRVKYLQAQQLSEEQARHLEALDKENVRISEQVNHEIQLVKIKFQMKLQELAPLPALLNATQRQLQDAQQQQALAEHRTEQLARELNCARDKIAVLTHKLNRPVEKQPGADRATEEKLLAATQQRAQELTEQNTALKAEVAKLKNSLIRMEETLNAAGERYQEKVDENASLMTGQAKIREEAERAVARANHRADTIRKCMQTTIAELERQLALSRALVATVNKEREELRQNMESQVSRLQDNCEAAHRRVRTLGDQVASLRKHAPEVADPASKQTCVCKVFLGEEK